MLRIKKLDIFIARQFGLLFVGTFFICQFVLMMQFLWKYVDELIGKGLSLDVLAQFFWYMNLMLVPQALPVTILLSTLITFGNLSENSEFTAIKAAGISLMQSFRGLIVITLLVTAASFYFQNNIGPSANMKLAQLLISMKQKSPELEIPEGVFYDGIPNTNLYVQKKDLQTGKLYGVMIYRMTSSYEDAAIILADSGMLQSTEEKKHLVLTLWSGEWYENMKQQELAGSASVPFRKESFVTKRIVLDFDAGFNMTDAGVLSNNARGKSLEQIHADLDSLNQVYDSVGRSYYKDAQQVLLAMRPLAKEDSLRALQLAKKTAGNADSAYQQLTADRQLTAINTTLSRVQSANNDLEFKKMLMSDGDKIIRMHQIEEVNKFTLALSCLIFFFIGAPLGTIIRKGGLGIPVIISVVVYIAYTLMDSSGGRMARQGLWTIWLGKALAPGVLIPLAVFVTYKAMNDSAVFNFDAYIIFFRRLLGLRVKRHVQIKEVVLDPPDYAHDVAVLQQVSRDAASYSQRKRLTLPPHPVKVFFKYKPDHDVERMSKEIERVADDLANTRDGRIIAYVNMLPILSEKAHTRPFERRWANVLAAIVVPVGMFLYFRMWRFRLRLHRDLRTISMVSERIATRVEELNNRINTSTNHQ